MALHSYSDQNPQPGRDYVRMLLADTDGSRQSGPREEWSFLLTDGEIDLMLSKTGGDEYMTAARLCQVLAAIDLARNRAVKLGIFQTTNEAADRWAKMAELYTHQAELQAAVGGPVTAPVAYDEGAFREFLSYKMLRNETN